ncbi:MAG: hypothetical protein AB2A00_09290 [Myxococcota bacterium]
MQLTKTSRRLSVALARVTLLGALLAYSAYGYTAWGSQNPFDFYHYWLVGKAIDAGGVTNIYGKEDRVRLAKVWHERAQATDMALFKKAAQGRSQLEPTGTPFLYAAFHLVTTDNYDGNCTVFMVVSHFAYLLALVFLLWRLGFSFNVAAMAFVLLTQLFWPLKMDGHYGNLGRLQVGGIALLLALLTLRHRWAPLMAGVACGVLVLIKPTSVQVLPLLVVVWLARGERTRLRDFVLGAASAGALGLALPSFVLGPACSWTAWRTDLPAMLFNDYYLTGGFLGKLIGLKAIAGYTVFQVLVVAGLAATLFRATPRKAPSEQPWLQEWVAINLGILAYLATGPIVHSHYFVIAAPALVLALSLAHRRDDAVFTPVVLTALLLCGAHPIFKTLGLTWDANHSLWTFAGVWLLLVLLTVLAAPARATEEPASPAPA